MWEGGGNMEKSSNYFINKNKISKISMLYYKFHYSGRESVQKYSYPWACGSFLHQQQWDQGLTQNIC